MSNAIDWFAVLAELNRLGMNTSEVARRMEKPESTLRMWKQGSEPRFSDGAMLLALLEQERIKNA